MINRINEGIKILDCLLSEKLNRLADKNTTTLKKDYSTSCVQAINTALASLKFAKWVITDIGGGGVQFVRDKLKEFMEVK